MEKNKKMPDGYILSYVNPDTDGICSSLALEKLYSCSKKGEYRTVLAGRLSDETQYVLKEAGINPERFTDKYDDNRPVILVDTHNLKQLPHLTKPENVIEIWDHHPDGNESDYVNANFRNYEIGAIASKILDELWKEDALDRGLAILLGSAILSNTINFTAPASTQYDRDMFLRAQKLFPFNDRYVNGLFRSKNAILEADLRDILLQDLKRFEINGRKCLISQLELFSAKDFLADNRVAPELFFLKEAENADFFVLNVIDIQRRKSYLFCGDKASQRIVEEMFGRTFDANCMEFDRILLRKTDLTPGMTRVLCDE